MTGRRTRYGADFKAKVALNAIRGELRLLRKGMRDLYSDYVRADFG